MYVSYRSAATIALDRILEGSTPSALETETLDFKEDPTRRSAHGTLDAGRTRDDAAARLFAEEAACLANHEGGLLVVGVDDKASGLAAMIGTRLEASWLRERIRDYTTPQITTACSELIVGDTRLLLVAVPRNGSTEPHSVFVTKRGGRRTPRRVGSGCHDMATLAEQMAWANERIGYDWSASPSGIPAARARPSAINAMRDYLQESTAPDRLEVATLDGVQLLRRLQLIRPDGTLTQGGAVLLCARAEPTLVYVRRASGGARSDLHIATTGRGLIEDLRDIERAIEVSNPRYSLSTEGFAQGEVTGIATSSAREAIVNAVMHRDWTAADPIMIDHVGNDLSVWSPGGLIEGVTVNTILTAPSRTRNRALGDVLRSLRLAEREGTGIDRMYVDQVRRGHEPPIITARDGGVAVRLLGGEPVPEVMRASALLPPDLQTSPRAAVATHLLRRQAGITIAELAASAQETEQDVRGFVIDATERGFLARAAGRRQDGSTAWRLADDFRAILAPILPYFKRPTSESLTLIEDLARSNGTIRNEDVRDALGVNQVRASQLSLSPPARAGSCSPQG